MTDEIENSEVEETEQAGVSAEGDETGEVAPVRRRRGEATNPFDYPFVFPALLFALMIWFGWDGWFNPKTESIWFNRIMCVVFAVASVWTAWVDWRVMNKLRERREAEAAAEPESSSEEAAEA